jgi:hypothetical protein
MATRSPAGLTLVEVAKRLAPDGSQARIAEVLAEKNDIVRLMTRLLTKPSVVHKNRQANGAN